MLNDTDTDIDIEDLDNYIDSLQANICLNSTPHLQAAHRAGPQAKLDVAMLQMAAHLNSMRPGANTLDQGFAFRLRERILVETDSSHQSSNSDC